VSAMPTRHNAHHFEGRACLLCILCIVLFKCAHNAGKCRAIATGLADPAAAGPTLGRVH